MANRLDELQELLTLAGDPAVTTGSADECEAAELRPGRPFLTDYRGFVSAQHGSLQAAGYPAELR